MHYWGAQGGIRMNSKITKAAGAAMVPRVMTGFRLSWLVYGAAAYYGLKFLNKRGILPTQTAAAIGLIDKGIDYAKNQFGLNQFGGASSSSSDINSTVKKDPSQSQAQFPH